MSGFTTQVKHSYDPECEPDHSQPMFKTVFGPTYITKKTEAKDQSDEFSPQYEREYGEYVIHWWFHLYAKINED